MKFCVVVPIYNEEKFLLTFLNSIVSQSVNLDRVICVDDNSTDDSASIIISYSKDYPFIEYVFHESGAYKVQGKKVINAFNFGLKSIDLNQFDIICKMDADLEFPVDYFEKVVEAFKSDNKVGIVGGRIVELKNGLWSKTVQADYHIRGALKSYRVNCFKAIGGLKPVLGWDGLDEMNAMYLGWTTKIIDSDVRHFRAAASDYNQDELNFKLGFANYCNGGSFFLAIIRSIIKSFRTRSFFTLFFYLKGYLSAYRNKEKKNVDSDLSSFINNFHLKRIKKSFVSIFKY
jgi:glycosyltransferase involved in cell wall biosynthesis